MRRALAALGCLAVAGCGGGDATGPAAPAGVAREVRAMFHDYTEAMGRADFAAACRDLTQDSIAHLLEEAKHLAPNARACPDLLTTLYGKPGSQPRDDLKEVVRTVDVSAVAATKRPDIVILTWSAEVRGRKVVIRQPAHREGGRWQLVAAPKLQP